MGCDTTSGPSTASAENPEPVSYTNESFSYVVEQVAIEDVVASGDAEWDIPAPLTADQLSILDSIFTDLPEPEAVPSPSLDAIVEHTLPCGDEILCYKEYKWANESSWETERLQRKLGIGSDGYYGVGTQTAHREALESLGYSTAAVVDPQKDLLESAKDDEETYLATLALQRELGVYADGYYGAGTRDAHAVAVIEGRMPLDSYPVSRGLTPVILDDSYPTAVRDAYFQMTALADPLRTVLVFDPSEQWLYVMKDLQIVATYRTSSGHNGIGNYSGSEATPVGYFTINNNETAYADIDFDIVSQSYFQNTDDCPGCKLYAGMTTRILFLNGMEGSAVNNNVNSKARGIAIHGTNIYTSVTSQTPQSSGCIRMLPLDVIELVNLVDTHSQLFTLARSPW